MNWADIINGTFEALAGIFVLRHCMVLYQDKLVRGVSIISVGFFFSWGIWNLYYYPSLDQWASFYGGLAIASANALWIGMMLYYTSLEKNGNSNTVPANN